MWNLNLKKAFDKVAKWDREFAEKIQRKYKLSNQEASNIKGDIKAFKFTYNK